MTYCFMNHVPAKAGDGLRLLADLPGLEWGIFEIDPGDPGSPENLVSDELAGLIESAKRYPPALGLAREELGQVFGEACPSQTEFARAYGVALRTHLSRQHESPYVLAPALRDEVGYLTKGEWYWVLGVSGNPAMASWVSDDFHIHSNDVNDFDFTGQQLKHLGYSG
jgi:hypothetical protein